MHLLDLDRVGLHLDLHRPLTPDEAAALSALVRRRAGREPAAYITGRKEFFGLDFHVAPGVLIPRPETELLVERALELASGVCGKGCSIADVGTGCGAIAISLAVNLPAASIYATDISSTALAIAERNSASHGVSDRITFLRGDLTDPLPVPVHLVVANLPYVRETEVSELSPEIARFEPEEALNGGPHGLDAIAALLSRAAGKLLPGGAILLEIGHDQAQAVCELARECFPRAAIGVTADLSGLDRVVSIETGR